jgi:hypothetical protein
MQKNGIISHSYWHVPCRVRGRNHDSRSRAVPAPDRAPRPPTRGGGAHSRWRVRGLLFLVDVKRFVPDPTSLQVGIGLLFGVLLWMVNFSPRIVWLRNRLRGEADVLLQLMPARLVPSPCAGDRSTLGIPQPFGRIVPDRAAAESA